MTQSVEGFTYTTAIRKLRKLKKRVRAIPGGTSAGKTFGILPILIDYAAKHPKTEISVVSESIPHLRKGALKDFLKIMKVTGRYISGNYNKTLLTYTFANESYIEFFSAEQDDKVRGPRRDILYINECNNLKFETYNQLAIRTNDIIWIDFNPTTEFWYHTEIACDNDCEELILTYKDNEALSANIVKEIEKARDKAFYDTEASNLFADGNIKSSYWSNWWKVYGMGMVGSLEGVIFNNWNTVRSVPSNAELLGYGIDFGFTNDPTSIIALHRYDSKLYWEEICYRTGMTNGDIANVLKSRGVGCNALIVADCAEPKSIEEINRYGFSIVPCEKGSDSVLFGIDLLSQQDMLVTEGSTNVIGELRKYMWDTDRNGTKLNRPVDAYNHAIDAMRYIATRTISKRNEIEPLDVKKLNEIFF